MAEVFNRKANALRERVKSDYFGEVAAITDVIEFQKRGLPHMHMLIILTKQSKVQKQEQIDEVIRAEIPDKGKESELYRIITRHNMHGSCGKLRPNSPCMSR